MCVYTKWGKSSFKYHSVTSSLPCHNFASFFYMVLLCLYVIRWALLADVRIYPLSYYSYTRPQWLLIYYLIDCILVEINNHRLFLTFLLLHNFVCTKFKLTWKIKYYQEYEMFHVMVVMSLLEKE